MLDFACFERVVYQHLCVSVECGGAVGAGAQCGVERRANTSAENCKLQNSSRCGPIIGTNVLLGAVKSSLSCKTLHNNRTILLYTPADVLYNPNDLSRRNFNRNVPGTLFFWVFCCSSGLEHEHLLQLLEPAELAVSRRQSSLNNALWARKPVKHTQKLP